MKRNQVVQDLAVIIAALASNTQWVRMPLRSLARNVSLL